MIFVTESFLRPVESFGPHPSTPKPATEAQISCTAPLLWKHFNYMTEWCLSTPTKGRSGWLGWKQSRFEMELKSENTHKAKHCYVNSHTNTRGVRRLSPSR